MIRKGCYETDLHEIHTLVNAAYEIEYDGSTSFSWKFLPRWQGDIFNITIRGDIDNMYLYIENEKILEYVKAVVKDGAVYIGPLAVCKEHQRRGIGSKFIRFTEALAKKATVDRVSCRTDLISFYEKRGYKEVGQCDITRCIPREGVTRSDVYVVIYEKVNLDL